MKRAHSAEPGHAGPPPASFLIASLSAWGRSVRAAPLSANIRGAFGVVAILFAIVVGIVALFFFNHRESATCDVTSVAGPRLPSRGTGEIWDVTTSCGVYTISSGTWVLSTQAAASLADSLQTAAGHNTYRLDFQGWGGARIIIGARLVSPHS